MWIRTINGQVLEIPNNESRDDALMHGDKIEDTCEGFEGFHKNKVLLPTMWGHRYNYDKFDYELDKGFVDEIYGGYYKVIGDFEAEFIAYCKYNRIKRCFEQIETKRIYE